MGDRLNFISYLQMDQKNLLYRRGLLLQEVCELLGELSMVRGNERQAKVEAYLSMPESSIRDRENMANKNAMHLTLSVWEIESRIEALRIEADFIKEILDAVQR